MPKNQTKNSQEKSIEVKADERKSLYEKGG